MKQTVKVTRASSFRANFYKIHKARVQSAQEALIDEALEFMTEREAATPVLSGSLQSTVYIEEMPNGKGVEFGYNKDLTAINWETKVPVKDYQYEVDERRHYWELPLQEFMRNLRKNVELRTKGLK